MNQKIISVANTAWFELGLNCKRKQHCRDLGFDSQCHSRYTNMNMRLDMRFPVELLSLR